MFVKIEILTGRGKAFMVTKADVQKNIDALERTIQGNPKLACDDALLIDTKSILEGIQRELVA